MGQGDPDCFGGRFPNGYFWVAGAYCLTGEIHERELWHYYNIDDPRKEYWYGDTVSPYQAVTSEELRGQFGGIELRQTPAWINAVHDVFRGARVNALNIELTTINGRFGVQYSQEFLAGQCYNFKLYIRANITQMFNPDVVDIRMEIHTTNGKSTLFNWHRIVNPLGEDEYTWTGFTRDSQVGGAILMFAEVRYPQLHGGIFVYSAGTLRAPQSDCFNPDGIVREGVYGF
jgi:hypothetical protein